MKKIVHAISRDRRIYDKADSADDHIERLDLPAQAGAAVAGAGKGPVFIWFDYLNRDPLTYKSRTVEVEMDEIDEETKDRKGSEFTG